LIYVNTNSEEQQEKIKTYVKETQGLHLDLDRISELCAKKSLPVPSSKEEKLSFLSSIFYSNLSRKELLISGYPNTL
jgi:hypothetical protein